MSKLTAILPNRFLQLVLFLVLILVVRFYPVFLQDAAVLFGDNYSLMVPGKVFTAHWLKQGVLPLWNPTLFGGLPWIGDVNQSVLYPSTLLFLSLDPGTALNLTLLIHLAIGMWGMYLLAWNWTKQHWLALMAGGMWIFSTQVTGTLNNISILQSVVWLPWLLYLSYFLTKSLLSRVSFVIIVLLQFLGGYPQHVVFSIVAAVIFSAYTHFGEHTFTRPRFMQWLRVWLITGVLSVGLSAIVWMPFLEPLFNSTRVIQTENQSLAGSLYPADLVKLVVPYFFEKHSTGMRWGPLWNWQPTLSLYVTWIGLLVSGAALLLKPTKRQVFLGVMVVLTLGLALGANLPGYDLLQQVLPLLKYSRGPSLILGITNVAFILLIISVLKDKTFSKRWFLLSAVVIGVVGVSAIVGWVLAEYRFEPIWQQVDAWLKHRLSSSPFHTLERDRIILMTITENLAVNAVLSGLALWAVWHKRWMVLALIVVTDMAFNTQGLLFFGPKQVYSETLVTQSPLTKVIPEYSRARYLVRNYNAPYTDLGAYWESLVIRQPFSDSYIDKTELQTFAHLQRYAQGFTPDWNMAIGLMSINGYTTLLPQDVNERFNPKPDPSINSLSEVPLSDPDLATWGVKYYLVDTWFEVKEDLSALPLVAETGHWKLYKFPQALDRFRHEDTTPAKIHKISETPNLLDLAVENTHRSYLIIADRYDQDWLAWVNEKPVQIENEAGLRKIPIESGINHVRLMYYPQAFYLGLGITALTLVLLLVYWQLHLLGKGQETLRRR